MYRVGVEPHKRTLEAAQGENLLQLLRRGTLVMDAPVVAWENAASAGSWSTVWSGWLARLW